MNLHQNIGDEQKTPEKGDISEELDIPRPLQAS
jgi:hypothetical protein